MKQESKPGRSGRDAIAHDEAGARDEEIRQYATGSNTLADWDETYENRPHNHGKTLFFSDLCTHLFDKLNSARSKDPKIALGARAQTPHEYRRAVVERFISKWRKEVGDDFFPAMRLILPASDRERGMYKLKESVIANRLIKVLKIDVHSNDAESLKRWKQAPNLSSDGQAVAGDFPFRCYQVLAKRPMSGGNTTGMRIADVNEMLDRLAAASGEKEQLPIFEHFYRNMNAHELQWLIRIILKQVKIGATEKTILDLWHPNAMDLFNVSSNIRRVCWALYDPELILTDEQTDIALLHCFLPQLAYNEMSTSFESMVKKLNSSPAAKDSDEPLDFWIEEKLDGERMQLHMADDPDRPSRKKFFYWSRKGKDYTYLYGSDFNDDRSSLTCHLKNAFAPGVRNIILDGEMIVWDPVLKKVCKFGTLKSAALAGIRDPNNQEPRPVFRIFDILYLNDQPLTQYTLRDRRAALARAVPGVPFRLEVHPYTVATDPEEIRPALQKIVSDASEGLVIKNPRSLYTVNERATDWIKVKPEYMRGHGKELDVIVIGGYYGSGRRGGRLSSFLCGLRVTQKDIEAGDYPEKCYSFLKVGGGFKVEDYSEIHMLTEGKWKDWDSKNPPSKYIRLAGGDKYQYEKPDVWIRPRDSIVIAVKAASLEETKSFASKYTFRFPRFRGLKPDRDWESALDYDQFQELRLTQEHQKEEKAFERETKRLRNKRAKRGVVIAGQESAPAVVSGPQTKVFEGLEFCILTDCTAPVKKTKTQLETLVRQNGGKVSQRASPSTDMILVAEKKVVKVASMIKAGDVDIVRPRWILDCVAQADKSFVIPYEPDHLFRATDATLGAAEQNVDCYGDSYARDLDAKELKQLLQNMPKREIVDHFDREAFIRRLTENGHDLSMLRGHLFQDMVIHLAGTTDAPSARFHQIKDRVRFGSGTLVDDLEDGSISHIIVLGSDDGGEMETAAEVRATISTRHPVPRVVTAQWIEDCWKNRTIVDEERYVTR
ncbi:ATP dependent DNA ligase domain-containing protein [Xylariaceae sp. FL1019]|nr:ATP dependent DNA ligase domain-containing protein [Xylariaceae sp. FL1019]